VRAHRPPPSLCSPSKYMVESCAPPPPAAVRQGGWEPQCALSGCLRWHAAINTQARARKRAGPCKPSPPTAPRHPPRYKNYARPRRAERPSRRSEPPAPPPPPRVRARQVVVGSIVAANLLVAAGWAVLRRRAARLGWDAQALYLHRADGTRALRALGPLAALSTLTVLHPQVRARPPSRPHNPTTRRGAPAARLRAIAATAELEQHLTILPDGPTVALPPRYGTALGG